MEEESIREGGRSEGCDLVECTAKTTLVTHRYKHFCRNTRPIKVPILSIQSPRFQVLLLDQRLDVFAQHEE